MDGRIGTLRRSRGVAVQTGDQRRTLLRQRHHTEIVRIRHAVPDHGLVLCLSPSERRLHGHHALSLRGQSALLALARPVDAVPFVALESNLLAVVPAPGTVRRGSWRGGGTGGIHDHLAVVVLSVGHRDRPKIRER